MRALLAAGILLSTSLPSFATCVTSKLEGAWLFSYGTTICSFAIDTQGKSTGLCKRYSSSGTVSSTRRLELTLVPSCLLTGRTMSPTFGHPQKTFWGDRMQP